MRTRSVVTVLLVTLFFTPFAEAVTFTDTYRSVYERDIEELVARGIVQGYGDGTFRPDQLINRAEFLKILMDARFPGRSPADLRCFTDLEVQVPQWYARPVCSARELGIVQGYADGTFLPDRAVNLAEALKMALRTFGVPLSAVDGGAWYVPYLSAARSRNILTYLLATPNHLLTRAEMSSITYALVLEQEWYATHPVVTVECGNGVREGTEQCDDGNNLDGDGCSSICILVPEPVRIAIVQIDQKTTGTLSTVARGQTDVPLLKFTAVSGRQDAVLTSLRFRPSVGSLLYGQAYKLVMDRNGDGTYETLAQGNGKWTGSALVFDEIYGGGVVLPVGVSVPFAVLADLVPTLGPVSLGLEFDTSLPDYIEAQGAQDGIQLTGIETDSHCTASTCFIRVNTAGTTDIDINETGNLFVTQDSLPVRSHLLVAGTTTDELLRLRLRAEGEQIDLRKIRIDGVPSDVESLLLYRASPGQKASGAAFAQASHGQCPEEAVTTFCAELGLGTFVIVPSSEAVIAVGAKLKNDQSGAVSGQTMTLSIRTSTSPSIAAVEARGISSLATLAQNDGDGTAEGEVFIGTAVPAPNGAITGMANDIALAGILSVTRDGVAESSPVPVGQTAIGGFKISAAPHTNSYQGQNDVLIQNLVFSVTAQNVQIDPSSFTLSTKDDPGSIVHCSGGASTGTFSVNCGLTPGAIQYRIGQGQSATYRLSANVTNPQLSPTSSVLAVTLPTLGQRTVVNSVLWSDEVTPYTWVDIPETSISGTIYRN